MDYYQILGVERSADQTTIRKRYLFLVKVYHPDRFSEPDAKAQAEEEMKRINEAYSILSDQIKRAEYDKMQSPESDNIRDEGNENNPELEEYFQYFINIVTKWNKLLAKPPNSLVIDQLFASLSNDFDFLIEAAFLSLESIKAKEAKNQIGETLVYQMIMCASLGAEITVNGIPNNFKITDLQIYSSMQFYQQIYKLGDQAKERHIIPVSRVDTLLKELIEIDFNSLVYVLRMVQIKFILILK